MCTLLPQVETLCLQLILCLARTWSEKLLYMLLSTCSKFTAFWYQKQCFGLFWQSVHGWIVLFGVKSYFQRKIHYFQKILRFPCSNVREKQLCICFGPFSVPKTVHFTYSPPVIGVHFIATSRNPLLSTNFVSCSKLKWKTALYAIEHLQQIYSILVPKTVLWTFLAICTWHSCFTHGNDHKMKV